MTEEASGAVAPMPYAWPRRRTFLTAEWRHLVMLNYAVDPELLAPFVPAGVELDDFDGTTYASIVGFRFLRTRVWGMAIPGHRDFDEVNLRFYVRRRAPDGVRRGVVFVRELVPRRAIAWAARVLYNEPYSVAPLASRIEMRESPHAPPRSAEYAWRWRGRPCRAAIEPADVARPLTPGSLEEFIAEHYWGYTRQRDGGTKEYEVAHPSWHVAAALTATLEADVAALYGPQFAAALSAPPASAFWADGSAVRVYPGVRLG